MIQKLYDIYLKHSEICIDTRKISDDCLFFALKGPNFNANEFAIDALSNGASYAVVDEEKYVLDNRYLLVEDVLETLQQLAKHHREKLNCPVMGITGTNGKTTSKELCLQVMREKFKTIATVGNLNNHIGVPLSLLSIPLDAEFAIIEMGANQLGEIKFLSEIAQPDCGVITNVGKAHLEGFGSLEGVLQTKTELYRYLAEKKGAVFIKDNEQILMEQIPDNCPKITYGQLSKSDRKVDFKGAQPFVKVELEGQEIQSQLIGDYNFDNIALSIALGLEFGVSVNQIKNAIESYVPKNNRSQLLKTSSNSVLLDAYNANPTSVEKAIHNLIHIEHKNKVMILGDMFELGADADKEHVKIINLCMNSGVKQVYFVGEIFHGLNQTQYKSFETSKALTDYLKGQTIEDAFVLIKGSRGMKLEQIVSFL